MNSPHTVSLMLRETPTLEKPLMEGIPYLYIADEQLMKHYSFEHRHGQYPADADGQITEATKMISYWVKFKPSIEFIYTLVGPQLQSKLVIEVKQGHYNVVYEHMRRTASARRKLQVPGDDFVMLVKKIKKEHYNKTQKALPSSMYSIIALQYNKFLEEGREDINELVTQVANSQLPALEFGSV